MVGRGGAGGAAGEQGSRHRNGVAAYLAVHGLVGMPVGGRAGAVPVRLHLEADAAVDDIVASMQDSADWFIQSKRTAGKDKALRDAIRQWVAQDLEPTDRVVLASRDLNGLLRDLQPLIDRVSDGRGAPVSPAEQARLDVLVSLLQDGGSAEGAELLRRVVLLKAAVEDAGDAEQANAIALLAGTIVDPANAPAAFEALRGHMQVVASRREWSGIDDWVAAIEDAGVRVYADGAGAPGARAQAHRKAESLYREVLAQRHDMLDLSALRPGIGLVHAANLLRGWNVEWGPEGGESRHERRADLANMVRRNRRFVLTGYPGVGKSEALRQIAASLAADPSAPLPIHIDLRDVVSSIERADDLTLDLLLQRPSRLPAGSDAADVSATLRESALAGNAILLVDGLDETRRRRGVVALGLAQLIGQLPVATGFILSTRPSALDAAQGLDLEPVRLQPPDRLDVSLRGLLSEVSATIAPSERADWLVDRIAMLERSSKESEEIWKIPLLASLATFRIADGLSPQASPAELLNDVVTDSVKTWEEQKAAHRDGLDAEMRAEMLLDGFVTIGRLINDAGTASRDETLERVADALEGWGHPPKLKTLLAEQVLHFWDERVGVFIDNDGQLTARSRQFAELADVRWISTQGDDVKRDWLATALGDSDRMHTIRLAASHDATIRDALIQTASRANQAETRGRAIDWLSDFWPGWGDLDEAVTEEIVNSLADAAEDSLPLPDRGEGIIASIDRAQRRNDGDGWQCVIALAMADLNGAADDLRRQRLAALTLSDSRRALLEVLMGLLEAERESRALTEAERGSIEDLLIGARPAPTKRKSRESRVISFERSEYFVTGVGDVIRLAVDHVDELSASAPDAFYAIAHDLPMSTYEHVEEVLRPKGYEDPKPFAALRTPLLEWQNEFKDFHGFGWALRALSDLYANDEADSPTEMWRDSQLADFVFALGWGDSSLGALRAAAAEDPALIATWFAAVIESHGLRGPIVAAQARRVLADSDDQRDFLGLITTRPLLSRSMSHQIDCDSAVALAPGFASSSSLIAEQVFELTLNAHCPGVADVVADQTGPMMWRSRYLATIAGIANAPDREPWLTRCAEGDSAERSAVATILPQLEGQHDDMMATLASDRDATVRGRAGGAVAGATEWTCTRCYKIRQIGEVPCPECNQHPSWSSS